MKIDSLDVIIPTWNRKGCVMDAVNSVLNQKCSFKVNVVVVDDGSSDGTFELFEKPIKGVKYVSQIYHKGVNYSRNTGVYNSDSKWILFLDSDDKLLDGALRIVGNQKLEMVNLFGTVEKGSGRKMYYLDRSGEFSYREWLEGKKIKGEFLCVFDRRVFSGHEFDEGMFCFESFWMNQTVRSFGLKAFDVVCREYSFSQDNRVSKELLKLKNVGKRYRDYLKFYKEFKCDFERFGLWKQERKVILRVWLYKMLSKVFK